VTHPRKLRKYFQEFIIGSSVLSPFVVRYLEFKKYAYAPCVFICYFSSTYTIHPHLCATFNEKTLYISLSLICYRFDYGYAIVMEDIGGSSLNKLLNHNKQGLPLDIFLDIACKISTFTFMVHLSCAYFSFFPFFLFFLAVVLAKGLGRIHAAGVIHKDINPSNIIYCEKTRELNIIDFGISSQLSKTEVVLLSHTLLSPLSLILPSIHTHYSQYRFHPRQYQ
jgi:serine/threonine protein kinase